MQRSVREKESSDDTTSQSDTEVEKGTANLDEVEGANETQVKHIHRQETWQEDKKTPDVKLKQNRRTRTKSWAEKNFEAWTILCKAWEKNWNVCSTFEYMKIWRCVLARMEFISFPKSHFG